MKKIFILLVFLNFELFSQVTRDRVGELKRDAQDQVGFQKTVEDEQGGLVDRIGPLDGGSRGNLSLRMEQVVQG